MVSSPSGADQWVPLHNTSSRIFARLASNIFRQWFVEWFYAIIEIAEGQAIAIEVSGSADRKASIGV